jgi:hypothetical protein
VPNAGLVGYAEVIVKYAQSLEQMSQACPYNQDRVARGLSITIPLGPDYVEQWSTQVVGTVGNIQLKKAFLLFQQRLVPGGLDPVTHWNLGRAVESPLDEDTLLPDDLDFALGRLVRLDNMT